MSVTCHRQQPSTETDEPTSTPGTSGPSTPDQATRTAILLADPNEAGYEVELPASMGDPQLAVDAIYEETPFIPHRKPAGEPTTYDSVKEFLEQHPDADSMRPIIESYFPYFG